MRGLLRVLFPVQRRCVVRAAITGFPRVPRRTMSTNIYAKLPKVELHVHADGACRLSTLQELSKKHDLPYPHDDPEKFRNVVSLPNPQSSLSDFLKVFTAITSILRTKEDVERIAYEFCEDIAKQNVVYAESRYNPVADIPGGPSPDDYVRGMTDGLERGQKEFGVKVRSILCFKRENPEHCLEIVRLAEKYRDRGVVAVDIAGDELLPLDPRHIEGFQRAKKLGFHITVHAAESGPASNVKQAVELLGAERIGHGYHVIDDDSVYQFAKEKGLHFEVCPTSSIYTNAADIDDHAVKRFAADGVSYSLNTDDPGVIQCDLTGEYDLAESKIGLTQEQLIQSVLNGARASFLPPDEKTELLKVLEDKIAQFRVETN